MQFDGSYFQAQNYCCRSCRADDCSSRCDLAYPEEVLTVIYYYRDVLTLKKIYQMLCPLRAPDNLKEDQYNHPFRLLSGMRGCNRTQSPIRWWLGQLEQGAKDIILNLYHSGSQARTQNVLTMNIKYARSGLNIWITCCLKMASYYIMDTQTATAASVQTKLKDLTTVLKKSIKLKNC